MLNLKFPAVSPEVEFIATHSDEADDIWYDNVKVAPMVKELSDTVYSRADKDVERLLDNLASAMEKGAHGLFRINNWHWPRDEWERYSDMYSGLRGRKKSVGWVGLHVGSGKEGFRLIGFMNPNRGGLDGRKKFTLASQKKNKQIHLTRDDPKRYPGWNDCVIWFEKKLTLQTTIEELASDVTKETRNFFLIAKPLLPMK
jgi:hypothetical protein